MTLPGTPLRPPAGRAPHGLGLLACAASGVAGLALVGLACLAAALTGAPGPVVTATAASGATAAVLLAVLAGAAGARVEAAVRTVAQRALDVTPAGVPLVPAAWSGRLPALVELERAVLALHRRVRVADEVSERHRATAVTTGAGVGDLLAALVDAEEGARGQLAAELHDTAAQSLQMARALLSEELTPAVLHGLGTAVEDAEEEVRALLARTRPPALRGGDLAEAVGGLRADLWSRYGLKVEVEWPVAEVVLSVPAATTVYRFFQEALLNVVKHADVDEAEARLALVDGGLVAEVRDRGVGGAPEALLGGRGGRSVGLRLLRERARLTGGALDVVSGDGVGTTVSLRLPLAPVASRGWRSVGAPA